MDLAILAGGKYTVTSQGINPVMPQPVSEIPENIDNTETVSETNQPTINYNNSLEDKNLETINNISKYSNLPKFLLSNLTEEDCLVLITSFGFLAVNQIPSNIIRFVFIGIISLFISVEYGISIAIILYAIATLNQLNMFIFILVILAFVHIFVPIPILSTTECNFNYILSIILAILMCIAVCYNKKVDLYIPIIENTGDRIAFN